MSAITITLSTTCSGNNHHTFVVSGDATFTGILTSDELSETITKEDAYAFLKVIAKMAKKGRTVAQAKTLLNAGVTVTV